MQVIIKFDPETDSKLDQVVVAVKQLKEFMQMLKDQLDAIQAAETDEDDKINQMLTLLATENQQVADLQAQLATLLGDNPAAAAILADMQAQTAKIAGALPPPAPAA